MKDHPEPVVAVAVPPGDPDKHGQAHQRDDDPEQDPGNGPARHKSH